jgi:GWxTD domain-containing protein
MGGVDVTPPVFYLRSYMLRSSLLCLAVAFGVAAPAAVAVQSADDSLAVRVVRFYRAEGNQTRVRAFVQIPYTLMQPANGQVAYQVAVKVTDSAGVTLLNQKWGSHAQGMSGSGAGAFALDMLEFEVAPGSYKLDVTVQDSVSSRQASASTEVKGYAADPGASDLLLSPEMRVASAQDSMPRPGELRRGNMLITAVAMLRLTPLRTNAFYLLEAYSSSQRDEAGSMAVAVVDAGGKTLLQTQPASINVAPGGGVLRGQVNLEGLPPGDYTMKVLVSLAGRNFERSAQFQMAGLDETLARDTARRAVERVGDEGYFAEMDEAALDAAEAPLIHIAKSGELKAYGKGLSVAGKRRFMAEFWKQRDPTPGTDRNERREAFYDAIELANKTYAESGRSKLPGWKTDRGRVYAKNGAPDDVLRRQQEGLAPPYEVWRYTRGRSRYYVFADRTGVGHFQLIQSNDKLENGIPDWREIVKEDAVAEIGRFVGEDFYRDSRSMQ